jgi:hypothetical protein
MISAKKLVRNLTVSRIIDNLDVYCTEQGSGNDKHFSGAAKRIKLEGILILV